MIQARTKILPARRKQSAKVENSETQHEIGCDHLLACGHLELISMDIKGKKNEADEQNSSLISLALKICSYGQLENLPSNLKPN